jgi:hypothetical protein
VTDVTGDAMLSPMMTVVVLAVLWLIVVVPMVIKRKDERAGERSVARFGGAMRSLSVRSLGALARPAAIDDEDSRRAGTNRPTTRPQVFVPGGPASVSPAARRPVPAAMEAVMYPDRIAKADMSQARRHMMDRRRRSLILLISGTLLGALWGVAAGGMLAWTAATVLGVGLLGYVSFLRSQALRDRERRETRLSKSGLGESRSYDATEQIPRYSDSETVVRIDDDDVELIGMADTVDLTGLYQDEHFDERPMRRAV